MLAQTFVRSIQLTDDITLHSKVVNVDFIPCLGISSPFTFHALHSTQQASDKPCDLL